MVQLPIQAFLAGDVGAVARGAGALMLARVPHMLNVDRVAIAGIGSGAAVAVVDSTVDTEHLIPSAHIAVNIQRLHRLDGWSVEAAPPCFLPGARSSQADCDDIQCKNQGE